MALASIGVIGAVGTGFCLGVHQLHGVVQLHMAEVGDGYVDVPQEVLLTVRCRGIGQNIVKRVTLFVPAEAIGILLKRHGLQRLIALGDIDLGRIIDQVEVVVVLHIAHVVGDIGAGVHGVEDLVPDGVEVQASVPVQIVHEAVGIIGIPFTGGAVLRGDGVCVIPGDLDLLPDLVGIVEGHVPVIGGPGLTGLGLEVGAGFPLVEVQIIIDVVIILISVALGVSFCHISQVCLPGVHIGGRLGPGNVDLGIVVRLIEAVIPIAAGKAVVVLLSVVRAGERRVAGPVAVLTVEVGGAVGHKDQVLFVGGDVRVLLQSLLTGQKTGVDVGATGVFDPHSGLYGVIVRGKIEPVGLVSLALELHNAHIHGGAAVLSGILQISQEGEGGIHHAGIGRRGAIQHEYHIGVQLFLCAGQGKGHVRGPGCGVQGRGGFGSGDTGSVAGVVGGNLIFGQCGRGQNACQQHNAQQGY